MNPWQGSRAYCRSGIIGKVACTRRRPDNGLVRVQIINVPRLFLLLQFSFLVLDEERDEEARWEKERAPPEEIIVSLYYCAIYPFSFFLQSYNLTDEVFSSRRAGRQAVTANNQRTTTLLQNRKKRYISFFAASLLGFSRVTDYNLLYMTLTNEFVKISGY